MGSINGKTGEYVRWLVGLVLAAVIAYFTTVGTMQSEIAEVRTRQDANFNEVLRRLDILQSDIREIRGAQR